MPESAFAAIEAAMNVERGRSIVLAADVANARRPGFTAVDVQPAPAEFGGFVVRAMRGNGASATIENTMAASAQNSVRYRALADQERSILREFRSAADDARR